MSTDYSYHRRVINERSKTWANRDGETWTRDEDDFLVEFWIDVQPTDRDEITVSQCLGRTTESCRVRCEKIRKERGWQMKFTQTTTVEYRGLMDDPDDCFWSPDYYTNGK
jgi:hypothetical protein